MSQKRRKHISYLANSIFLKPLQMSHHETNLSLSLICVIKWKTSEFISNEILGKQKIKVLLNHNDAPCRFILSKLITEPHLKCFFDLFYLFYLPQNTREKSLWALLGGKVFTIKTISMRNFTYKYLEIFPSNEFHYRTEFVSNYKWI